MKIKEIKLKNVKGFKEFEFDFQPKINKSSLTVILGENGTGKSTILKSIINTLTVINSNYKGDLFDESDAYLDSNEIQIEGSYLLNEEELVQIFKEEYLLNPDLKNINIDMTIEIENNNKIMLSVNNDEHKEQIINFGAALANPKFIGANIFYFDPFRFLPNEVLDGPNSLQLPSSSREGALAGTVLENKSLNNRFLYIKQWLINLDFIRLKSPTKENLYIFDKVSKSFDILFSPFKFEGISDKGEVLFSDGERTVEIDKLSEGFKSVFILIGEILFRLSLSNPDRKDFFNEESIILIDEIDCHLHPKWQVKILPYLMELFSNSQFIVTTHSPFITNNINKEFILKLGDV